MTERSSADAVSVIAKLTRRNAAYAAGDEHRGDIGAAARTRGAREGQAPWAVVVTCSDSRVVPEHLFNAGLGELFVIRTAGNVVGPLELGSIEYAVDHLGTQVVVVLGHTQCGAVDAALKGGGHGNVAAITSIVGAGLPDGCDPREAERLNVQCSLESIRSSELLKTAENAGALALIGAIYDIETGVVDFFSEADGA